MKQNEGRKTLSVVVTWLIIYGCVIAFILISLGILYTRIPKERQLISEEIPEERQLNPEEISEERSLNYLLKKKVEIHYLVLDQEAENVFNNDLPVVTFPSYGNIDGTIPISSGSSEEAKTPAGILCFSDSHEVTLHFKLDLQPVFAQTDLISIKSPSGEKIEVIEDPYNENYYYMVLTEEGIYVIEYLVRNEEGKKLGSDDVSSFYWLR